LRHDPSFLLLEVSDTGCGISPDMTERIFERLYQVSERIETSRKGLGLGLYICKELVTRQGGEIWVRRGPEKGSTFSFTLPVLSLNSAIAPLLVNDRWPAESPALVVVETRLPGAWPSKESQEGWAHEARGLLQRCLMLDRDVLLPNMSPESQGERIFVAAFADDTGASVLVSRIRAQFERFLHLKHTGLTVSVSYSMLQPFPRAVGASTDAIVTSMATTLEAAITSHSLQAVVSHE
jgi:hypothetical protein